MGSIYQCSMNWEEAAVLEQLRQKIAAAGLGVTLQGNRLTVRWTMDGQLVDAHMVVESVTTPAEAAAIETENDEIIRLSERVRVLEAEASRLAAELMDRDIDRPPIGAPGDW